MKGLEFALPQLKIILCTTAVVLKEDARPFSKTESRTLSVSKAGA